MKKFTIVLLVLLCAQSHALAGFDDFIKDVLTETQSQAIGSSEYSFAPGDPVIQKDTYAIYYSGSELNGANRVLLLTLLQSDGSVLLKYPSPETIQVKNIRLQILGFDNKSLRVRVLQ